jgi:hypothetical protein
MRCCINLSITSEDRVIPVFFPHKIDGALAVRTLEAAILDE